jgi:hypothetical protein
MNVKRPLIELSRTRSAGGAKRQMMQQIEQHARDNVAITSRVEFDNYIFFLRDLSAFIR